MDESTEGAADMTIRLCVDGLARAYRAYGIVKAFTKTEGVEHAEINFDKGSLPEDTERNVTFTENEPRRSVNDCGFTPSGVEMLDGGSE